jgi:hypothetical protein
VRGRSALSFSDRYGLRPLDHPVRAVAVHTSALESEEDRSGRPLHGEVGDVRVECFGDSQPVQRKQRDERTSRESPSPAWTSSAPSSLRSSPRVRDSSWALGRRTFSAGFLSMMSSIWQYLWNDDNVDNRRPIVEGLRPCSSIQRANISKCGRWTFNKLMPWSCWQCAGTSATDSHTETSKNSSPNAASTLITSPSTGGCNASI